MARRSPLLLLYSPSWSSQIRLVSSSTVFLYQIPQSKDAKSLAEILTDTTRYSVRYTHPGELFQVATSSHYSSTLVMLDQ
ncbi:hypothetical protein EV426DRAFT_623019 [Tirmania nivea]|nr:hypothetical protein EV426DRAFT_623019 [Tirmania nivea]